MFFKPKWHWRQSSYNYYIIDGLLCDRNHKIMGFVDLDLCRQYRTLQYNKKTAWFALKDKDDTINNFGEFCDVFDLIKRDLDNFQKWHSY